MTIPKERSMAIENAELFLRDLLNPKATPKVPREVRERARRVLRHFPSRFEMMLAKKKNPELWGEYQEEET